MAWSSFELLAGLAALILAIYYYYTARFNYWKDRRVAGPKPWPFVGNFGDVFLSRSSIGDLIAKEYKRYKDEPAFGLFMGRSPVLVIKDPEYIKDVLIKDFSKFADRGFKVYEKVEPLNQNLFALDAARWRPLRHRLSPIFTSGKLKEMFYLLLECADHFERFLGEQVEKNPVIECRELTAKFTTDVIGVCAFGLNMNSFAEEDSEFRKVGRKMFQPTLKSIIHLRVKDFAPWLYRLLGAYFYQHEINDFFIGSMQETLEHRKSSGEKRKDFVDLLLALKENPDKVGDFELTDTLITAQAFVFFAAGFETSSTTISNALYELALHPELQEKLRAEIMEELESNDGKVSYETVKSMKYLHKVFSETLRKYPVVTVLQRQSMESYKFSDSKLSITADTAVIVPVYAIQRDPEIYPDPDGFDPERFSEENVKQRHPSYYLPFGDGPRNCIGARFGVNQTKVGLITVLKNYRVEVCDETCIPYVNDPKPFLLVPVGGIKLKFTKL